MESSHLQIAPENMRKPYPASFILRKAARTFPNPWLNGERRGADLNCGSGTGRVMILRPLLHWTKMRFQGFCQLDLKSRIALPSSLDMIVSLERTPSESSHC